ncbi:DUF4043 family protein [Acinetobacter thermotolerans]|uniref:phage capsid family protein n=1 Tax=Acinetobacter thermotolerans TaxID=3151487 RepID=UPI00325AE63D
MSKTNMASGDRLAMTQQAVGLFAQYMQSSTLNGLLTGAMPKNESQVEKTLRKQTSTEMPIVRVQDLGKHKGDEVSFYLMNPVGGYPIMGSNYAEGRGLGMSMVEDKLRVNQARFPIDAGNVMTEHRSPFSYRKLARPVADRLMRDYCDQSILVHMAGARGYHNNIEWRIPLETDPKFKEIMVNPVKAPSKNRHFMVKGGGLVPFKDNSGVVDIASTDVFGLDAVDSAKTLLDEMPLPPPPVKCEGDASADDSPLRVWLVSPAQYNAFAAHKDFRSFQAAAFNRASNAKSHPLFKGDVGLWNGFIIRKMPRPIRFYAGNPIKYCASHILETESSATVPADFASGNFAIDRSIILGGQALAEALAASGQSGIPFFWSEKELDHGDKFEILVGAIRGVSKIRFNIDRGDEGQQITDHGIIVVDSVVKVPSNG